jgi:hypothetical protein
VHSNRGGNTLKLGNFEPLESRERPVLWTTAFYSSCQIYKIKIKSKILGSECQTSGTYAKRAKQETKIDSRLCFLNYLAFLRPAADRAVYIRAWVVSRGRSCGFLWAVRLLNINVRKDTPTPVYSPVSDRRRLAALVEVHWTRRVQALMPQISRPNLPENHIIVTVTYLAYLLSKMPTLK